ncbi:MAG TPA: K(+)-transporting ATPase subunit F [Gemmatimonadaceae bacterium]|jgi:K+-transporting ATPase KdpF subunit
MMTLESLVTGILAVAILVYLIYTLLRPERF